MEQQMEKKYAIEVKDLKKQFKVYYDKGSQLKEKMLFKFMDKHLILIMIKNIMLKRVQFN